MGLSEVFKDAVSLAKENPLATSGLAAVAVGTTVAGTAMVVSRRRKKKKSTKTRKYKRVKRRSKRHHRRTKYARTAGKRKDTSRRRIRMTKSGQPYIILASGKARFISKKSARASRKRKGGRY